jgi:hypothetical protein
MARVRTFKVDSEWAVSDKAVTKFITDCEEKHYVNVTMLFVPFPTPRVTVCVTKLDEKDPEVIEREAAEEAWQRNEA